MDDIYDSIAGQKFFKLSAVLFAFFLLLALIGFHSAWIAAYGHGFQLHFDVAAPWFFALIAGSNVYGAARRKQMKYYAATAVLNMLSFGVFSAYAAMGKLSELIQ